MLGQTTAPPLQEIKRLYVGFPDYSTATRIHNAQGAFNYSPTDDGWIYVLTSGGTSVQQAALDVYKDGTKLNSISVLTMGNFGFIPVRKGYTYKMSSIREANFCKNIS